MANYSLRMNNGDFLQPINPMLQVSSSQAYEFALPNQPANFDIVPVHSVTGSVDDHLAGAQCRGKGG